jgi:transposase
MGKPYSMDLRERVTAAVKTGGMSCDRAAKQFRIGVSTGRLKSSVSRVPTQSVFRDQP